MSKTLLVKVTAVKKRSSVLQRPGRGVVNDRGGRLDRNFGRKAPTTRRQHKRAC